MKTTFLSTLLGLSMLAAMLTSNADIACAENNQAMEKANNTIEYINNVIKTGNQLLDRAKTESDVAMMDCLNTQLITVKGFLNVAQNSSKNISDATQRNDEAAISHNTKLIELTASKAHEIELKMKQCSSGVVHTTGDTSLTSNRTCQYPPCLTDIAHSPESNEGLSAQDQMLHISYTPNLSSPYL